LDVGDDLDGADLTLVAAGHLRWDPIRSVKLKVVDPEDPREFVESDCPYFAPLCAVCLSTFAQIKLAKYFSGAGYFVDTDLRGSGMYKLFFVTRRLDALDLDNSEVKFFESGNVWDVFRHELIPERIGDCHIFQLEHRRCFTFVSEKFVNTVKDNALVGFSFQKIWSSATGGVSIDPNYVPIDRYPGDSEKVERLKRRDAGKILEARSYP
jgi:hypothetical protein